MFFSRCTLRCLYCQNYPWSQMGRGEDYSPADLLGVFRRLRQQGCHNWNWVSPTPWLPALLDALDALARAGETLLPVVVNTSGYERVETIRALAGRVAVYLADLRYADNATALEASGADDYVESARAALEEMWRQVGPLREEAGVAASGVIVRVLVLPGHAAEACASLRWLAGTLGRQVAVSVMAQYVPAHRAAGLEPWGRPVTGEEYEQVCEVAGECGFETGWFQEHGVSAPDGLVGFEMAPSPKAGAGNNNGGAP